MSRKKIEEDTWIIPNDEVEDFLEWSQRCDIKFLKFEGKEMEKVIFDGRPCRLKKNEIMLRVEVPKARARYEVYAMRLRLLNLLRGL